MVSYKKKILFKLKLSFATIKKKVSMKQKVLVFSSLFWSDWNNKKKNV